MKQIAYILIGLLLGFILAGALFWVTNIQGGTAVALKPSPTKVPIEIQVIGGVVRPGVYTLPEGSRVQDAITASGGLLAETDPNSINLVAKLEDGEQLVIPKGTNAVASTPFNSPFTVISTPGSNSSPTDLININTATLTLLDNLPGIGPTTAQKIIDYRTLHGPFTKIEEIINVPGIGPATFDRLQKLITTN
jgi:competence protein ComEA